MTIVGLEGGTAAFCLQEVVATQKDVGLQVGGVETKHLLVEGAGTLKVVLTEAVGCTAAERVDVGALLGGQGQRAEQGES